MSQDEFKELKELTPDLTFKDKVPLPYLLATQILTFQKATLNLTFSEREIQESIDGLQHLIPEDWKDTMFQTDIDKATKERKIDNIPKFCGISASKQFCEEHKIEVEKTEKVTDYFGVLQACMNLLYRRGMLPRKEETTIIP